MIITITFFLAFRIRLNFTFYAMLITSSTNIAIIFIFCLILSYISILTNWWAIVMNAIFFNLAVVPFLFFTILAACCILFLVVWYKTIFLIIFLCYFLSISTVRLTFIFNSITICIITLPVVSLFTVDTSIGGFSHETIFHIISLLISCDTITNWFTGKGSTWILRWNTVISVLFLAFLATGCVSISRITIFIIIFDILTWACAFYATFIYFGFFILLANPWVHNLAVFASMSILISWITIFRIS